MAMHGKLKFFNTLGRKVELFVPIKGDEVGLYTCGPTVYGEPHIGNMRSFVFEDLLKRTLVESGYHVKHVMNITDVGHLTSDADEGEDKMEKGARRDKITAWDVAKKYTDMFLDQYVKLNIILPDVVCKATDYIQEQIALVKKLEEKGFTYRTDDGIYFDTSKLPNYGELGLIQKENLEAGKRIAMGGKKNNTDFALWKFSPKDAKRDMEWESPWGIGFPGWHIECSAMSMKHLGNHFDIHCGGEDLAIVHHSNEIAQSEAASGEKFVNYWMHGAFLIMDDGRKMAKSAGDNISVGYLIKNGIDPLAYRYVCLTTHYRTQMKLSFDAIDAGLNALNRLREIVKSLKRSGATGAESEMGNASGYVSRFEEALENDLNVPQALAITWEALRDEKLNEKEKLAFVLKADKIFGLNLASVNANEEIPAPILELVKKRDEYRKAKNWEAADAVRKEIEREGYVVRDGKNGAEVSKL